jgi:hypothetical protein
MKISIGDLFVFHSDVVGYISNISLNKHQKRDVYYDLTVMKNHQAFESVDPYLSELKIYKYHEESITNFIEKSPYIKYYSIVK